jgi:hypothetical protein
VQPADRRWCPGSPPAGGRIPPQIDVDALEVVSRAVLARAHLLGRPEEYQGAFQLATEVRRLKPLSPSARGNVVTAQAWWFAHGSRGRGPPEAVRLSPTSPGAGTAPAWDPDNRSVLRQRGEVTLLATEAAVQCKVTKACDPPPSIEEAESMNLQALAIFRWLQGLDERSSLAMGDVGWALLDRGSPPRGVRSGFGEAGAPSHPPRGGAAVGQGALRRGPGAGCSSGRGEGGARGSGGRGGSRGEGAGAPGADGQQARSAPDQEPRTPTTPGCWRGRTRWELDSSWRRPAATSSIGPKTKATACRPAQPASRARSSGPRDRTSRWPISVPESASSVDSLPRERRSRPGS